MQKSEQINELGETVITNLAGKKELFLALHGFQAELTPPPKNHTAKGKSFSYRYADLADILAHIRPLLDKFNFAITHSSTVIDRVIYFTTTVVHVTSMMAIETTLPIPIELGQQDLGGATTYYKRYNICSLLNIVADDDKDGQPPGDTTPSTTQEKPTYPSKVQPILPEKKPVAAVPSMGPSLSSALDFIYPFKGRNSGRALKQIPTEDLIESVGYWRRQAAESKTPLTGKPKELVEKMEVVIASRGSQFETNIPPPTDEDIPF